LGVKELTNQKCMDVATLACAEKDTLHNMPFEVNSTMVAHAIKAADALGYYYLNK